MFKSLVFVSLLVPSCVSNIRNDYVNIDSLPYVETLENNIVNGQIFGAYNLKDTFDLNDLLNGDDNLTTVDINCFDSLPIYSCFINIDSYFYFLKDIHIVYDSTGVDYSLDITYYTDLLVESTYSEIFADGEPTGIGYPLNVLSTTSQNLIIYLSTPLLVSDYAFRLFNGVFTTRDNAYTVTYNGYYNLMNTNNIPVNCNMYGSVIYDSSWFFGLNHSTNSNGSNGFSLYYSTIKYERTFLEYQVSFPTSQNILLSGCKMTRTSYNRFLNYGSFSFVYEPSETTFNEMIFTVMDVPVYFLSQLLSFELFGVNMFIALTGLLTLCMILLLIRKFF